MIELEFEVKGADTIEAKRLRLSPEVSPSRSDRPPRDTEFPGNGPRTLAGIQARHNEAIPLIGEIPPNLGTCDTAPRLRFRAVVDRPMAIPCPRCNAPREPNYLIVDF